MPRSFARLRRVDVRDRLVADPAEEALQHGEPEDARVVAADVALEARSRRVGGSSGASEPNSRPRRSASGRNGRSVSCGLGGVDVDGERHELAGERQLHHVGDRVAGLVLRLAGAGAEVRRDHDLSSSNSGDSVVGSVSNTSSAAPAITPSRTASASAASSTIPPRATLITRSVGLALSSRSRPISPAVSVCLRQVDREEVGLGDDLVERQQLDAHLAGAVGGHERVVGDEPHAERLGPVGDELADAAEADDAERLVGELDALPAGCAPSGRPSSAAWAWGTLRAWASSSAIVCSAAETMFDCGALTTITPRRGGGVDVDVVEPDAGPADDDELGAGRRAPRR